MKYFTSLVGQHVMMPQKEKSSSIEQALDFPQNKFCKMKPVSFSTLIWVLQVILQMIFYNYDHGNFLNAEYSIFSDIMVMLLLSFGYLMTFSRAMVLVLLVWQCFSPTWLAMELNLFMGTACQSHLQVGCWHTTPSQCCPLLNAEFYAAIMLISFGAIIRRAMPLQLVSWWCSSLSFTWLTRSLLYLVSLVPKMLEVRSWSTCLVPTLALLLPRPMLLLILPTRQSQTMSLMSSCSLVPCCFGSTGSLLLVQWKQGKVKISTFASCTSFESDW